MVYYIQKLANIYGKLCLIYTLIYGLPYIIIRLQNQKINNTELKGQIKK